MYNNEREGEQGIVCLLFLLTLLSWLLPTDIPMADEMDVDECPAPKQSNSDSDRLANPDSPPLCRSVCIRSLRPVRILCGYTFFFPTRAKNQMYDTVLLIHVLVGSVRYQKYEGGEVRVSACTEITRVRIPGGIKRVDAALWQSCGY